ncbi:MAG: hypothetical protein DRP27_03450 [Thermotogae bacterium]|nr:MAG: hypothetical protein DRP27_03450 [Thermotogota bacterium]
MERVEWIEVGNVTLAKRWVEEYEKNWTRFLRFQEGVFNEWFEGIENLDRKVFEKVLSYFDQICNYYVELTRDFITTMAVASPMGQEVRKMLGMQNAAGKGFNAMMTLEKVSKVFCELSEFYTSIPGDVIKMAKTVYQIHDHVVSLAFCKTNKVKEMSTICSTDNRVDMYKQAILSELLKNETEKSQKLFKIVNYLEEIGDACTAMGCEIVFALEGTQGFCHNDSYRILEGNR